MTKQKVALDRDVSDALLQGLYYQKYVLKTPFEMSYADDSKVEEGKSIDLLLPPFVDPVPETKPKRKPTEKKSRAKREKLELI